MVYRNYRVLNFLAKYLTNFFTKKLLILLIKSMSQIKLWLSLLKKLTYTKDKDSFTDFKLEKVKVVELVNH
ncbi:hypothetical protein D4Z78_00150 [Okeania hirsuta]|nr:hypothetical protein D4Z78_00150 [Okeania hirsuta]